MKNLTYISVAFPCFPLEPVSPFANISLENHPQISGYIRQHNIQMEVQVRWTRWEEACEINQRRSKTCSSLKRNFWREISNFSVQYFLPEKFWEPPRGRSRTKIFQKEIQKYFSKEIQKFLQQLKIVGNLVEIFWAQLVESHINLSIWTVTHALH